MRDKSKPPVPDAPCEARKPKKRGRNRPFVVECRYLCEPYASGRLGQWFAWRPYATKRSAELACDQLNNSHGAVAGKPFMEFRLANTPDTN